jgi:glycine/D-amino acid oxidase-like deaminating enzyme
MTSIDLSPGKSRSFASRLRYDIVIVGGGVIGSSAAYFLAANPDFDGSILVVERDWTYAKSATALSSASIRQQFSNALNVQISQFGVSFIRNVSDYLSVSGEPVELHFKENGYLLTASEGVGAAVLRQNHATQKSCGADVILLEPERLRSIFPWINVEHLSLASYGQSGEGWFDNVGLLNAFRRKAIDLGVEYVESEVVDLKKADSRIDAITLSTSQVISCGKLLNSAGTRGPKIARMAEIGIPVEPRRRNLFVFASALELAGNVPLTVTPSGVFFRPEGKFYLAGTSPVDDPEVDVEDFDVVHNEFDELIWPALFELVPSFEAIKVVGHWAGHYDYCTLDHNAIVGPHDEIENFLFANGFSGHGLQQAPAIGRGLSELIIYGGYRSLDLSPLSYKRVAENRPFRENAVI